MKSYADNGWVVDLIAFVSLRDDDSSVQGLARICRDVFTVPREKYYALSDLLQGLFTRTPFPVLNYTTSAMTRLIGQLIQKNHYDLVQIEDIMMCNNTAGVSGVKIILDMHNVQSELMRRYALNERRFLRKIYARMTAGKLVRYESGVKSSFKMIFVCSEEDRRLVLRNNQAVPVAVVPNGVDSKFFTAEPKQKELDRIVFVGDLGYHANTVGVSFFVEKIFPLVRQQYQAIQFVIVGKNPSPQIAAYASDAITVTGMVADVRPYLESAKVVAVPLLTGGGTRLKILEAMAMGKAIVSTPLGSEGIPVEHNKHILLADTPELFAEGICELLKDGQKRQALGEEACKFVKTNFDWSVIGTRLINSVDSLFE